MSVYACADFHGAYWFWEGVKSILQPDDKLYFLGDAADRGPDGWQIIKELVVDPRVIYIKGNHEDMMLKAIGNITKGSFNKNNLCWNKNMNIWFINGAQPTYNAIMDDDFQTVIDTFSLLKDLPFCCIYTNSQGTNILLSHAGCDSFEVANTWDEYHFIWDRSHWLFADEWLGEDNELIVHGHTPIEYILEEQKYYRTLSNYSGHGAYWYGQGHKVCLDTGAVWYNEGVLLNLDTYEEIIIHG